MSDCRKPDSSCGPAGAVCDRRGFLFGASATVVSLSLPRLSSAPVPVQVASFARQRIGTFSRLQRESPIAFRYPWDHPHAENVLLKLGEAAGGGIGPDRDVVAFNGLCTHQGASMSGTFDGPAGIAGPCPLHWTTFDLSRHGTVISGHATAALPQIQLEADGDDIIAVGVQGLIFGFHDLHQPPN